VRKANDDRKFSFTDTKLERWRPDPEREVFLFDTDRPQLMLRVSPAGAKTFYFVRTDKTRPGPGKASRTVKVRIGLQSEWTVEQARARVDELNAETSKGGGRVPTPERRPVSTLGEAWEAYIAHHVATGGRSEENMRGLYRLYLEPHAGRRMADVDKRWITDTIKVGIVNAQGLDERRRRARTSDGRATANSVLGLLSAVFSHWLDEDENNPTGQLANPCERVKQYQKVPRKQALEEDEVPRFLAAVERYKREHAVYKVTRTRLGWVRGEPIPKRVDLADLLTIALFTGQRRGAVARMRWADVTLDGAAPKWVIPPEHDKTKTGKSVALHPKVVELLAERRAKAPADAVFVLPGALGGNRPKMHKRRPRLVRTADPRKVWRKILELAGIKNPRLVPHSLRATFVTEGIRAGHNLEAISRAVGHASINTTREYAALVDEDKRKTTHAIGDRLAASVAQAQVEEEAA
jgi:integrase